VKVQFFWDREGKRNENSSCWLRVSTSWAGKNWGMVSIPRIGQEVVVSFLEGDPDQPIIVGSVYNGEQMPPYDLPGNKTQSGLKSRSSLSGSPANFNEIRFEDKKGSEQLFIHAEKNQDIEVENDETHWVGRDQSLKVDRDKFDRIERDKTIEVAGKHLETIGASMTIDVGTNQSISVGANLTETVTLNYAETVGAAMELTVGGALAISVGAVMAETVAGASVETVGGGKRFTIGKDLTQTVGENCSARIVKDLTERVGGQHKETVEKEYALQAKKIQLLAEDEIIIKTGDASITLKKNGDISINGKKINVQGSGDVVIKGSKIKEN
jgi:type VI secretion system secreted protein VgrG